VEQSEAIFVLDHLSRTNYNETTTP